MFDKERFGELGYILNTPFIVHTKKHYRTQEYNFAAFKSFVSTLNEHRNKKLSMNRISVTADLIKQRATGKIKWDRLMEADAMLYYISLLNPNLNLYHRSVWFPETTCYHFYEGSNNAEGNITTILYQAKTNF